MSDALFKVVQTTRDKIPTIPIISGTMYFCTDTREIFVDEIGQNPQRIAYPAIPENLSDFNNDVGFITDSELGDEFVKKAGDTMTGSLTVPSGNQTRTDLGVRTTDKSGESYRMIGDNRTNLWVGAGGTLDRHHVGGMYISTGYDSENSRGNDTLYISVPNSTNDGGTNYPAYHDGYRPYTYGVCSTADNVAAKEVTTTVGGPSFKLQTGSIVFVKFSQVNTAENPTLNINNTGAKAIKRYGTTAAGSTVATSWYANSVVGFIYDGTQFQMMNWLNTDTNTTYNEATTSTAGLLSATDKGKLNRVVMTSTDIYNNNGTSSSGVIWSNSTNKIGIGATQVSDKQNYRLYARADHIAFASFPTSGDNYTPGSTGTTLWTIYPTTGTSPITVTNGKVSHANSGVSAGTIGTNNTTALTPGFGSTFSVPGFAVNATGHVTSASSHTVKIPDTAATTSAAGLMSAADKTKLNKFSFAAGITTSAFGDGTNTTNTYFWGNSTNKVALGATNSVDNARWNLLVREGYMQLQKDSTTVWSMYPFTAAEKDAVFMNTYKWTINTKYKFSGVFVGYVTESSKEIWFSIQHGYIRHPSGTNENLNAFHWCNPDLTGGAVRRMNNATYFGNGTDAIKLTMRVSTGGYVTPGTTAYSNLDLSKINIRANGNGPTNTIFVMTRADGRAWTKNDGTTEITNNAVVSVSLSNFMVPIWTA